MCRYIYTLCIHTHTLLCLGFHFTFLQKEQQRNSTKMVYLECKLLLILQCISISMEGNFHSKSHTVEQCKLRCPCIFLTGDILNLFSRLIFKFYIITMNY